MPIGNGSNLLVADGGVRGVVARLRGDFEALSFEGERVAAGAAVFLPALARQCAERGLAGAEGLMGIPGTVGGGLMTNAGTSEGALGDVVEWVEVLGPDGDFHTPRGPELVFTYRHSNLAGRWVASVGLKLRRGDGTGIMARARRLLDRRAATQPLGAFNCGSVFKNPPGDFAARLIETAGLKGRVLGGARVSPKHANFIENTGRATARDVMDLIRLIRHTVYDAHGVRLELEVWPVGEGI
jgi:UDP-N-acetylmuramate dehydrogenase